MTQRPHEPEAGIAVEGELALDRARALLDRGVRRGEPPLAVTVRRLIDETPVAERRKERPDHLRHVHSFGRGDCPCGASQQGALVLRGCRDFLRLTSSRSVRESRSTRCSTRAAPSGAGVSAGRREATRPRSRAHAMVGRASPESGCLRNLLLLTCRRCCRSRRREYRPRPPPMMPPFTLSRLVVAPMIAPAAAPMAASRLVCFSVTVCRLAATVRCWYRCSNPSWAARRRATRAVALRGRAAAPERGPSGGAGADSSPAPRRRRHALRRGDRVEARVRVRLRRERQIVVERGVRRLVLAARDREHKRGREEIVLQDRAHYNLHLWIGAKKPMIVGSCKKAEPVPPLVHGSSINTRRCGSGRVGPSRRNT